MKKNYSILLAFGISAFLVLNSCSKKSNDPSPSSGNSGGSGHITGSTVGSVTLDGTTTATSGGSTNNQYGFVMTTRNMTPANSYPAFNINFSVIPAKDSTYSINSNNFIYISVADNDSNHDQYVSLTGDIVVDVEADHITATVTSLTVQNGVAETKTVSGYVTYYK